ncbi:dienelactone hydrolase family protein [Microcella daejeonensis]|uniref:dienelactone hydrolase family protein n=1 Tax=Microcella daejeonensis TaxID=2994971 RepID=UPI00226D5D92|nr:dienelactone hydrolase family protein [Microcella daejeonensis]WAB84100.1 dienelactone hydrolase family protein [Microcella daejeonensis]
MKRNSFWLALALVLALVSAIGASLVQTGAGAITTKDLRWETASGRTMNALLFTPESATADSPAPAIVVSHGWWNNREMQSANYVELARRGYVVLSIDMYGHGNSDPLPADELMVGGTGMYDGVLLLADLPYVDTEKIGITGHSNGARAANFSIPLDDAAPEQLISSVLLVDYDPIYTDADGAYVNPYGTRDVGLIQAQYDEFFFRSYSEEGAPLTAPRDYLTTPNAQSFLHFGAAPEEIADDEREGSTVYTESIEGTEAMRVVYSLPQTHPWTTNSSTAVGHLIDFFEESLGAPAPAEASSQIWQVKETFTALGLIAFGILLVTVPRALLTTRAFRALAAPAAPAAPLGGRIPAIWFWAGIVVSAIISGVSYIVLSQSPAIGGIVFNVVPSIVPQGSVFFIALWAAINGLAALVILAGAYFAFAKKGGLDLRAAGVLPGWRPALHGTALALTSVVAVYALVFLLDFLFTTDFRLWVIGVKVFSVDKIGLALFVLPLFLLYFVVNSIAINAFNRVTIGGREWINTALLAVANSLAPLVLVIAQYTVFAVSGELIPGFGGIFSIWLFPVIVILAVTAIVSRKLYRATGNPYVAGVLNATIVALVSVSNSLVVTY